MAGVRSTPEPNGKYKAWFTDARGKRRHFVGTRSKAGTLHIAQRKEDDSRQIRLGYRPAPTSADKHLAMTFADATAEYIAWGKAQGGRGGRAWSTKHAQNIETKLTDWQRELGLDTLADLHDGILAKVEGVLRDFAAKGRAAKTMENRVEPLRGFCRWAVKRGFLADDPLRIRTRYDVTPRETRRALTEDEIKRLLTAASDGWRRLVYEVALCSGLRAGELRSLRRTDLDTERGGFVLSAAWTKNRRDGFQPLPAALVKKLADFAASGEADRLYRQYPPRQRETPTEPLLYLPDNTSRMFALDREKAGIPKQAFGGRVDFHALRVWYVTGVLEVGAGLKEAQTLARHATPGLTLNVYGRARDARLAALAELLGETVQAASKAAETAEANAESAALLPKQAAGAEGLDVSTITPKGNGKEEWWRRWESNPRPVTVQRRLLRAVVCLLFVAASHPDRQAYDLASPNALLAFAPSNGKEKASLLAVVDQPPQAGTGRRAT